VPVNKVQLELPDTRASRGLSELPEHPVIPVIVEQLVSRAQLEPLVLLVRWGTLEQLEHQETRVNQVPLVSLDRQAARDRLECRDRLD
jgi:hypothetical protein